MKIVVVGATGTIGKFVVAALQGRHDVVKVGNRGGDHRVDITDTNSIRALFMAIGLQSKLMGQINLVLIGRDHINDNGSFTLTSGLLNHDPIRYGAAASLV